MLVIDDLTVRIAGRALLEAASARITPGARVGLVGRNGTGKSTLFNVITGDMAPEQGTVEYPPRWRIGRLAQEAPNGPESLLEVVLKAHTERTQLLDEAETAHDPHRIAEIQTRLVDIDAHSAPCARRRHPVGPRLFHRRSGAALFGIFRRLAHARGARRHAVLRARPAAARRADQLSRSRRHAVAAGSSGALSEHHDHHQPRPRPARQRGQPDPVAGKQAAHALSRRLFRLRTSAPRAHGARPENGQEAGSAAQAYAGLRRPLPRQGDQGAAGAIAHQDAGEDGADRLAGHRRGAPDPFSGAGQAAVAADHRHRRRRGRL